MTMDWRGPQEKRSSRGGAGIGPGSLRHSVVLHEPLGYTMSEGPPTSIAELSPGLPINVTIILTTLNDIRYFRNNVCCINCC